VAARQKSADKRGGPENALLALLRLVDKNRRRYGGYLVHLGICAMFPGFLGGQWELEREVGLNQGEKVELGRYTLTYTGSRMCPGNPRCSPAEQADLNKRMVFADLEIHREGEFVGQLTPAKFIFHKSPESPTTEVSMRRGLREDLYAVLGSVNPETKHATFKLHLNPLVSWIWVGLLILMGGTGISLWPEVSLGSSRIWAFSKAATAGATGVVLSIWLAMTPTLASAEPRPRANLERVSAASPLPRLFHSGAWVAPVAGHILGIGASRLLSRRKP
jgi:cytochrome c-type biogenesis protein CcmF